MQEFAPFGSGGTADGGTLQFTGHERDAAAVGGGIADLPDYMHARYYDVGRGRFLTLDPINSATSQQPQSWNKYAYALNNPLKYVDPNGKAAIVRRAGHKIFIEVPVRFSGKGATPERIEAFKQAVQTAWSGTFGRYEVTTTVTKGGFFSGNRVTFDPRPEDATNRSNVITSRVATIYTSSNPTTQAAVDSHEAGHLMKNDDRHDEIKADGKVVGSRPKPGWEGNIMAQVPGTVEERNIEEVLQDNRVRDIQPEREQ